MVHLGLQSNLIMQSAAKMGPVPFTMRTAQLLYIRSLCPTAVLHIAPELLVLPQDQFDHLIEQLNQKLNQLIAKHPEFSIHNWLLIANNSLVTSITFFN